MGKSVKNGVGEILLTSMNSMALKGNLKLKAIWKCFSSRDCSGEQSEDMVEVVLKQSIAVLAASIFHYGIHSISSVKKEMTKNGIKVRDCEY